MVERERMFGEKDSFGGIWDSWPAWDGRRLSESWERESSGFRVQTADPREL